MCSGLFQGIELPPWTDWSPIRLYALFNRYRAHVADPALPFDARRDDQYCRLLMHVVAMNFAHEGWVKSLRKERMDPEDVASQAVTHLRRKSGTNSMLMKVKGWRPMLKVFNQACWCFVMDRIETGQRRRGREVPATDFFSPSQSDRGWTDRGMDGRAAPAFSPEPEPIEAAIIDAEDQIIGDVVCSQREASALEKTYRILVDRLLKDREMATHASLPPEIRQEVTLELHGLVSARINRFVRERG